MLIAIATGALISCAGAQDLEKIEPGALIVDVRTRAEFEKGSYPGAINIPLQEVEERLREFGDARSEIVVFCRSGNRSGQARDILVSVGFTNVKNGGGLDDMLKLKKKTSTSP